MRIDWDALKNDFESGAPSLSALGERYGCHKDTIRRKAKKEGWKRGERQNTGAASPSEASEHRTLVHLPERHRNFWRGVERRLARGLKTKDLKQGIEELKVAKMAGEVISSMIRSKRLELGLEDGSAGKGEDDAQAVAEEMARVTASSGAEQALD